MSVSTTTNLSLKKPTDAETVAVWLAAHNDNADAIDTAIAALSSGKRSTPTRESYTITTWTPLADKSPYTYSATVTATATIGNDTLVELINDNAVLFATHGFAIGAVSGQNITIYSVGEPASSVTLQVDIGG